MRNTSVKLSNNGATQDGLLTAEEDTVRFTELKSMVTSSGITLDPANGPDTDVNMAPQSMARYASGGVMCQDSGIANAHILSSIGSFIMPKEYFDGMIVVFKSGSTNTGVSTINAFNVGGVSIVAVSGNPLEGGEIIINQYTMLIYSNALGKFVIPSWSNHRNTNGGYGADFKYLISATGPLDASLGDWWENSGNGDIAVFVDNGGTNSWLVTSSSGGGPTTTVWGAGTVL